MGHVSPGISIITIWPSFCLSRRALLPLLREERRSHRVPLSFLSSQPLYGYFLFQA